MIRVLLAVLLLSLGCATNPESGKNEWSWNVFKDAAVAVFAAVWPFIPGDDEPPASTAEEAADSEDATQ